MQPDATRASSAAASSSRHAFSKTGLRRQPDRLAWASGPGLVPRIQTSVK